MPALRCSFNTRLTTAAVTTSTRPTTIVTANNTASTNQVDAVSLAWINFRVCTIFKKTGSLSRKRFFFWCPPLPHFDQDFDTFLNYSQSFLVQDLPRLDKKERSKESVWTQLATINFGIGLQTLESARKDSFSKLKICRSKRREKSGGDGWNSVEQWSDR